MVLWVFDGNMVEKCTNEPCNGVDELVNPFWVLTSLQLIRCGPFSSLKLAYICLLNIVHLSFKPSMLRPLKP